MGYILQTSDIADFQLSRTNGDSFQNFISHARVSSRIFKRTSTTLQGADGRGRARRSPRIRDTGRR
jgi:hypothetical protein